MRYIIYNSGSELASFMFEGYAQDGTTLIDFAEKPEQVSGKIGRGMESLFAQTRLGLYPEPRTRRLLEGIVPTDLVIFFAIENTRNIENLKKYIATRDVHVFLWNPIGRLKHSQDESHRQISKIKDLSANVYTFDREDAANYGLKMAPQPYRAVAQPAGLETRFDFYFSGVDKGRLPVLLELKTAIVEIGMRPFFHIVGDKAKWYTAEAQPHIHAQWIRYADSVRNSQQASCLVEIIQEYQSGPTLRSMEALFLQKKIITNRSSARDDAFFDPDRVLVIDKIEKNAIEAFMRRSFAPIDAQLRKPHEICMWIRNLTAEPST